MKYTVTSTLKRQTVPETKYRRVMRSSKTTVSAKERQTRVSAILWTTWLCEDGGGQDSEHTGSHRRELQCDRLTIV